MSSTPAEGIAKVAPKKPQGLARLAPKDMSNRLGRSDRSPLGVWFWELDRVLLSLLLVLMAIGLLAVAAGSPASAQRLSTSQTALPPLYFFYRQLAWVALALPVMFVISMYPREQARRFSIGAFGVFLILLLLVPLLGKEVNGSQRWIGYGPASLQPSEFLKPFYSLTMAWILTWRLRDPAIPARLITAAITGLIGFALMIQPDLGQTILFSGIWFSLMMVSGVKASHLWGSVGGGIGGILLAYKFYPVATQRIDAWVFGTEGITHDKLAIGDDYRRRIYRHRAGAWHTQI